MSPAPFAAADPMPHGDPAQAERLRAAWRTPTGWRYWSSVNNSQVGQWYTASAIVFFLFANVIVVEQRKAA